jgi:hypothetical protein
MRRLKAPRAAVARLVEGGGSSEAAHLAPLRPRGDQPQGPAFTPEDEATLRGMFDATPGYFMTGNLAPWAQQFAENAVLQPPNAPAVSGRANILA